MNIEDYQMIKSSARLSFIQIDYMKHALGIDGRTNKKYKAYRNYFYADGDDKEWDGLVEMDLAEKPASGYYRVSKYGVKLLEEILNIEIKAEWPRPYEEKENDEI